MRRLVRRVVINMHARIAVPGCYNERHDRVECLAFLALGLCPERLVHWFAALADTHDTEEELPAAFAGERIAFEIEKQIAARWFG